VSRVKLGKDLLDETQIELRAEMERFMNGRNRSDRRGERDRGHLEETSAEESTRRGKQIVNRILTAKSSKLGGELWQNYWASAGKIASTPLLAKLFIS